MEREWYAWNSTNGYKGQPETQECRSSVFRKPDGNSTELILHNILGYNSANLAFPCYNCINTQCNGTTSTFCVTTTEIQRHYLHSML